LFFHIFSPEKRNFNDAYATPIYGVRYAFCLTV
jgi:hypothetical protein